MSLTFRKTWLAAALLSLLATEAYAANFVVTVGGRIGNTLQLTYTPSQLTINVGDTVTFRNAGGIHNVIADDGSFRCALGCEANGGNANLNDTAWEATVAFNTPGTFGYFCELHPSMRGSITVQGTAPPPPPPPANLGPGYTGAWFNPAQDGHGIFIEILPNNIMVAAWYVFAPGGGQSWIVANGPISGNTANLTGTLATGTRFPPNFAAADVVRTPWGALNFTFSDCNTGRLDYSSTLAGYGSGSIPLSRLTLPAGSACAPTAAASQ